MSVDLSKVRNIGVAAHIDAGKTTTTERILYYTGRTHRVGDVDLGTTTTDFDEQEQQRGITIYSAAVTCPWLGHTINLIDTPGHVDFTAEVERSLRALDGMVAVFDAREGVEPQSETVWRQAEKYKVPRICFINKMDKIGADFDGAVASIRDRLHTEPLAVQYPIGAEADFVGIVDLIENQTIYFHPGEVDTTMSFRPIPDHLAQTCNDRRRRLIEAVADVSERVMEKYLAEETIGVEELWQAVRAATLTRRFSPVLCGSALKYVGVRRLLDAVCYYLPSPLDVPPVTACDAKKPDVAHEIPCDPSGPVAALVFKVVAEKPLDLYYLRLYSGTLKPNMRLLNTATGEKENVSRIYRMFAKRRDQLNEAIAGEIIAIVGPKSALTGHTLCDQRKPVILEPIQFPDTVISVSVEPRSSKDRDKLLVALRALSRQDPTMTVSTSAETGQTLISGMGELHLEIIVHRLRSELRIDAAVGKPRVTYRETVTASGEGEAEFDRQIGGRQHLAKVRLRIEPRQRVEGAANYEIVSRLIESALTPECIQAMERGIRDAAQCGVLGGYPVIDWKATIVDALLDEKDASEIALENAARRAFDVAMTAARPVLLQPIMSLEVVTPDEYFGAVVADLNARRAEIKDALMRAGNRIISAEVPLAQVFGYVTRLRSLSQGRATSTMTPSHYAPVSASEMKALVG